MIIKTFEYKKIDFTKNNIFLFYGDNHGFKNEYIENISKKKNLEKIKYFEKEILDNPNSFFESIFSKSFFENEKFIIIKNVTDKIRNVLEEIIEKNIEDTTIIFDAEELQKKSKIRNIFEKDKKLICTPFYPDNYQSLNTIAQNFIREQKIQLSQEITNLIIERSNGSRHHLNKELEKIGSFALTKKNPNYIEIQKITNLGNEYDISELVDNCLAKNKNKISRIINENNFSGDETIMIIRTFLIKTKRLYLLKKKIEENQTIEKVISEFKPPIFWKDKELVKLQLKSWTTKNIKTLLEEINNTELLIKKNFNNSINILLDFINFQTNSTSN